MKETKTTVSAADDINKLRCSNSSDLINETSSNNIDLHDPQSFPTTVSVENDASRVESNTIRIEVATVKNSSSSNDANSVVPFEIKLRHQNVTSSSTDLTPNRSSDASLNAKNVTFKVLDNCLKQSLNDIARRQPNRSQVFEILKNKAKHTERAARKGNEIDDYERYRTKISSPTNEFWRNVTFPTDAPFTKRTYRRWGLNGFRTSLRKSRKRAKSDVNADEKLRQFYGVEKNEAGLK
ncbi:hypothetical protein RF55_10755 [Lasius niger]|uniref:Uncharacterized protein n=1 Tax=Lasius niger TaxID=67767 RepID=A0A0J7KGR5_LASNI|nr:hypothetical protein RF55_10755 [Lasius niger]